MKKTIAISLVAAFVSVGLALAWSGTWTFEEDCTENGKIDVTAHYDDNDGLGGTVEYTSPHENLETGAVVEVRLEEDHGQNASYTVTNTEDCTPPPQDVCPNIEGNQEEVPEGMKKVNGQCVPIDVCPNIEGNQSEIPEGYEKNDGQCVEVEPPCEHDCTATTTPPVDDDDSDGERRIISTGSRRRASTPPPIVVVETPQPEPVGTPRPLPTTGIDPSLWMLLIGGALGVALTALRWRDLWNDFK